jgi:hypothetical protein
MKHHDYILHHQKEFLEFLKSKYPMYHLSNIFFRDIQFGVQSFLAQQKLHVGYAKAEQIAGDVVTEMEKKKILTAIDRQSWVLHYPEFRKPAVKTMVSEKPATPGARPAGAVPPQVRPAAPLPPLKSARTSPAGPELLQGSMPLQRTPSPADMKK